MKKTDLEKLNGLKIRSRMKNTDTPDRFAKASSGANGGSGVNPLVARLLKKGLDEKGQDEKGKA
ncbi:hypothetical protein LLG90_23470 [Aromatoleum toluclasticum]|uniref:hypothetical protein n=1 Tax=Aromatoleum toluclasticum TaxID=92003 RepID=UPI001D18EC21|nr:hypothetical protein [Aromatoleum toluclasticum]MCC4118318.1 hypothetical protein [Aromatoleum toluclasticum]